MAQVDQADGTRAEQQRRAGPRQLREQELGGPGEDDGGHRHRRQRRYAALQGDHAIDHAEWRYPQQQGQNRAQAKQESLARNHLREGMFTMTMPPTTMAAARMKCRLGRSDISTMPKPTPKSGVRKENTSSRPAR